MADENTPQDESEEVEAHHFTRPGPEEPQRIDGLTEEDDDEVEAHHFMRPGPEESGNRA